MSVLCPVLIIISSHRPGILPLYSDYDLSVDLSLILSVNGVAYVFKIVHLSTDWNKILFVQESEDFIHDLIQIVGEKAGQIC